MIESPLYVASVGKAFQILDCFKSAPGDLSLSELVERSGMGKSAVQRYAYTLCAEGYLEQNPVTRRYQLGKRVLDFTFHFLRSHTLVEVFNPLMLDLSKASGEKISLSLLDGNELVYAMRHQTKTEHFHASLVGRRVPLYCTAGGRAVLSQLTPDKLDVFFETTPLVSFTPRTITDAQKIRRELNISREKGYSTILDEFIMGEIGLGAAVRDEKGVPYGALHVSGSSNEWSLEAYEQAFAPMLLDAIGQFERRNHY
ncbi:IclR family transcriptional regulator [Achromobacter sp. F4_2707]|uniref:IclR family transcriptional regulator n=1 Tax=Achromobacter sp. F4_2707 TaxID=3114286 RepID=UPI0039C731CB